MVAPYILNSDTPMFNFIFSYGNYLSPVLQLLRKEDVSLLSSAVHSSSVCRGTEVVSEIHKGKKVAVRIW